jgi:hypothetical protein
LHQERAPSAAWSCYLAWPEADALYRLDPGGPLMLSRDGGARWEEVGSTGGEPHALVAPARRRSTRR